MHNFNSIIFLIFLLLPFSDLQCAEFGGGPSAVNIIYSPDDGKMGATIRTKFGEKSLEIESGKLNKFFLSTSALDVLSDAKSILEKARTYIEKSVDGTSFAGPKFGVFAFSVCLVYGSDYYSYVRVDYRITNAAGEAYLYPVIFNMNGDILGDN